MSFTAEECILCSERCTTYARNVCNREVQNCHNNCYNSGMPLGACIRNCDNKFNNCVVRETNTCERNRCRRCI